MTIRSTPALVQLPLGVHLRESASFASFYAGPNAELLHQIEKIAAGTTVDSSNTWFISGPEGSGKTHLLQAAVRAAGEQDRSVAYVPLTDLLSGDSAVLDGLTDLSLVCLDDIQQTAGHRRWEEALMGLCDGLRARRGSLIVAGTAPPMELRLGLKDLATRLAWGPVYALKPLDDGDKLGFLQLRARHRGLELPDETARFLLNRSARDIPALLVMLDRLDHASLAAQRKLTIPFVRDALL